MKRFAIRITRVFAAAASAGILTVAGLGHHPAGADQPLGPAGSGVFGCLHPQGVNR